MVGEDERSWLEMLIVGRKVKTVIPRSTTTLNSKVFRQASEVVYVSTARRMVMSSNSIGARNLEHHQSEGKDSSKMKHYSKKRSNKAYQHPQLV